MSQDGGALMVNKGSSKKKLLKTKLNIRKGHRGYVTRVLNEVNGMLGAFNGEYVDEIRGKRAVLTEKLCVLEQLDNEIMSYLSEEDAIEEEVLLSSEIRSNIHSCIVRMDSKISENKTIQPTPGSEDSKRNNAKLPKLELKSFGGNPIEFQSWWDNFKSAVHDNQNIGTIMKFNYLRNYVHGSALSSIEGLQLTSDNYDKAIKIIRDRFANEQLLITTNIDKLLSIPTVNSTNNIENLREVYNKVEIYARNLQSLNVDKDQYGPVLISIIMSKIPQEIKLQISRAMPTNDKWCVDELLREARQEIESREICSYMTRKKRSIGITYQEKKTSKRSKRQAQH